MTMTMHATSGKPFLAIDQGNSSAKLSVWLGGKCVASRRFFDLGIEETLDFTAGFGDCDCAYCSVGKTDAKYLETLRREIGGDLLVLTHATPLPIRVEYGSRATLGNDRVAAACGACSLFPGEGLLVVDAGTAMTIDRILPGGVFCGGDIAPGMQLRFRSLHEATSQLPLVSPDGPLPDFGNDTATAIRCGVVRGMAAEIQVAFAKAASAGCSKIVLAGSDTAYLRPVLEEAGLPVSAVPDLVGIGLESISRHNKGKE